MFNHFEHVSRPSWKRRVLLIGSLLAHGAVVVALLVASWLHVAEITPPLLAVMFVPTPPPPPPQVPGKSPEHKRPAMNTPHRAPTVVPQSQPQPQASPSPVEDTPGTADGPPSGTPGGSGPPEGIPGGTSPSQVPTVSAPAPRPRNVSPHQLDTEKIAGADPHLPEFVKNARRGMADTRFVARLCVDRGGSVSRVDVLQGIPGADEPIIRTLRGWQYKPQPVPVCFVGNFVFNIAE
jgi:protein TonB